MSPEEAVSHAAELFTLRTDLFVLFFFQAEDGIRDLTVTGVQTCALPIFFSKAFDASPVSMCASSRITTLLREAAGAYLTISRNSRIWSIPRFEAASI